VLLGSNGHPVMGREGDQGIEWAWQPGRVSCTRHSGAVIQWLCRGHGCAQALKICVGYLTCVWGCHSLGAHRAGGGCNICNGLAGCGGAWHTLPLNAHAQAAVRLKRATCCSEPCRVTCCSEPCRHSQSFPPRYLFSVRVHANCWGAGAQLAAQGPEGAPTQLQRQPAICG